MPRESTILIKLCDCCTWKYRIGIFLVHACQHMPEHTSMSGKWRILSLKCQLNMRYELQDTQGEPQKNDDSRSIGAGTVPAKAARAVAEVASAVAPQVPDPLQPPRPAIASPATAGAPADSVPPRIAPGDETARPPPVQQTDRNVKMVHEMLLENTAAKIPGNEEIAAAAIDVKATVKRAFWDALLARLLSWQETDSMDQLAADVGGLIAEVQQDVLAMAPGASQQGQAIRQDLADAVNVVRTPCHLEKRYANPCRNARISRTY
jgi:hypothetical protein